MNRTVHSETRIYDTLAEIRRLYLEHFDKPWISGIIEELPLDARIKSDVETLIQGNLHETEDRRRLRELSASLCSYTESLEELLGPKLKELMTLTNIQTRSSFRDHDSLVKIRLMYSVFPDNFRRFKNRTLDLWSLVSASPIRMLVPAV